MWGFNLNFLFNMQLDVNYFNNFRIHNKVVNYVSIQIWFLCDIFAIVKNLSTENLFLHKKYYTKIKIIIQSEMKKILW